MELRKSHIPKSLPHRENYLKYLKTLENEPTLPEPAPLTPSNEGGEELREPTSKRKRDINVGQRLKDHIHDNLATWLCSLAGLLFFYFMVDSKIDIARISSTIDAIKNDIVGLKADNKQQSDKGHERDLTIREYKIRIENLEAHDGKLIKNKRTGKHN